MAKPDYSVDLAEIRAIDKEPSNTYWHVLDRISFMNWPQSHSRLRKALEAAPEGVRLFWLTRTIEGPIEDGGFGQYFGRHRPTWLHEMAKQAILEFGCPQVVRIITEAEQYLERHRTRLRDGMSPKDWAEIMGPVAMNKATRNIHRPFFRACSKLHDAREKYLNDHPERFSNV